MSTNQFYLICNDLPLIPKEIEVFNGNLAKEKEIIKQINQVCFRENNMLNYKYYKY